jgi:beta-galactosidase
MYSSNFSLKMSMIKIYFVVLFLVAFIGLTKAQKITQLSHGWEFYKSDLGSPFEAIRSNNLSRLPFWESISMPHCYNAFDAVDPDVAYYQGPAWYRTLIQVNNPYKNGHTLLHFEGAGQKTKVYIGAQLVGSHVGGYDEFTIDITNAVNQFKMQNQMSSDSIPLLVRCDNSRDVEMIPSDLSDFNIYGGLYRHVNLVYQPANYLSNTQIDYELASNKKLVAIAISSQLQTKMSSNTDFELQVEVLDAKDQTVVISQTKSKAWTGLKQLLNFEIKKPQLWSPETPILYQVNVALISKTDTSLSKHKIGFRTVEFVEKGPLLVNGKRLLLRGTHRHEDHAGYGAAMPDNLIRKEMLMMKDMGVNFIRLGHYQQSNLVLDLCDSLGIFVWEEIPWCRGGLGHESYKNQARNMLTNMINQHYNHTSVLVWGLGNENDWPGDFDSFIEDSIRAFMQELNDLVHMLDSKRMTSIRRCDFCKDIVDVYSPSIWAGWYRGQYTNYKEISFLEAMKVNHFLHVEWGASNHANRHSEDPDQGLSAISTHGADERAGDFLLSGGEPRVSRDGDWSETYACNLIDWHLKEQETMDWLTGTAYWPFKDFSTPLRPENPIPYINQKGVVERDLTPKESYYLFQSYWTTKPMVHIYGHTWETRWGMPNEDKLIKVYSNCKEAELFLNNVSMGVRKRNSQDFPAAGLRWKVQFNEGSNHVKVLAKSGKEILSDEISFTYQTQKWGTPEMLELKELERNQDTIIICARIYDKNGVFCPDSKELITFGLTGNGILLDNLGTANGSRKIQMYNGKALIKIKLPKGKTVASVLSENCIPAFLNLSAQ